MNVGAYLALTDNLMERAYIPSDNDFAFDRNMDEGDRLLRQLRDILPVYSELGSACRRGDD